MEEILFIAGAAYAAFGFSSNKFELKKREKHFFSSSYLEKIKNSAKDLYLHSLRIHGRLPEELHNAMMLWCFHPTESNYVKEYLIWADLCDKRQKSRESFEKKIQRNDSIIKVLLFALGFSIICLLILKP